MTRQGRTAVKQALRREHLNVKETRLQWPVVVVGQSKVIGSGGVMIKWGRIKMDENDNLKMGVFENIIL